MNYTGYIYKGIIGMNMEDVFFNLWKCGFTIEEISIVYEYTEEEVRSRIGQAIKLFLEEQERKEKEESDLIIDGILRSLDKLHTVNHIDRLINDEYIGILRSVNTAQ